MINHMNKYKRPTHTVSQKDVDRFWTKVDIQGEDDCWNWQLTPTKDGGYGLYSAGGTLHRTSRFAYIHGDGLYTKKIMGNLRIATSCRNKLCCNPGHMKLNSQQEVFDKMRAAGQISVGSDCKQSKLREADVVAIRARYVNRSLTHGYGPIGVDYGVSTGCIRDIIIRKTWRHV